MENASKALIIAGAILISILLISIGIILINSGKDVTSTGTAGMNSQKIQTFNSQFTAYEGDRKGSEITSLVNTVMSSNATDSEHQVAVYAPVANVGSLTSTKTYTVTVNYSNGKDQTAPSGTLIAGKLTKSEQGYINYISISNK